MSDQSEVQKIAALYQQIGYQVIVSKADNSDLLELQRIFPERLTVFMDESGAGKSTLLNRIVPELDLETAEISESLVEGNIQRDM